MADQEKPTSEHEAQVRRLLAQSRVEEPMPQDVVRRLDGVLEGLSAPGEPAIDLAARRRRRRVSTLLIAAAAVFVVGIGVEQVLREPGGDSASTSASSGEAEDTQEAPDRAGGGSGLLQDPEEAPPAAAENDGAADEPGAQTTAEVAPYAIRLGGGGLTAAVEEVVLVSRGVPVGPSGYLELADKALGANLTQIDEFACTPADWGPGRLVPVIYKGTPNVLALRSPEGKTQVVEVLQCGTAEVVRSLTLPAS